MLMMLINTFLNVSKDIIKGTSAEAVCCPTLYLSNISYGSPYKPITEDMTTSFLNGIDVTKATDNDGIPAVFLKTSYNFLIKPIITCIIN